MRLKLCREWLGAFCFDDVFSQLLAEDLVGNVVEHIRMQRIKNGNDVSFEHREEMLSKLTFYLDLLEFRYVTALLCWV